jgi:hypothetical protein
MNFSACVRDWLTLPAASNADPANIGVLSTDEACAAALLLDRLDLLGRYKHPLDALDRLGPEREKAVRDLHSSGWRR